MNIKGYSGVKPVSTIDKSNKDKNKDNFYLNLMKYQMKGKKK